ncbi:MAG: DNA gyrase subunit A [Anaerolineae bacterium]
MEEVAHKRVDIEETMRTAYLSYAMSVITARALPDVRDGLKPVQRRILYAMYDMGLRHDRPTRKSARIVGEVLGKYHPHGDSAVYEAMVRMAQDFSMRYPLVEGQGNFGSVDGDGAAAVRYTEARLSVIGDEMLTDLEKDSVDLGDNFDGSLKEPLVLPAKVPNLLVNGVGGIAVGMATNIPPHNLGEIADAVAYLVDRYHESEDVTLDELMHYVHGPDFPTGGMILGDEGIRQAYATGRGRVVMRSQVHPEELSGGRLALIVTELPYQVNKSTLVGRIATLAREGRVDGIGDLRDESDRMGIRVVIELKRGVEWEPVLASLLKYSQLQTTFGVNMLALVDGEPRTLSLKRALLHYIDHRYTVVERRTRYDLEKARQRAHILEGLLIALDHLDEVIDTIRRSRTAETAKDNLQKRFGFTDVQAQAILDLQLRRLAALERRRVQEEYRDVIERIAVLQDLLSSEAKIRAVVKDEILELKRVHGDPRRTRVSDLDVSTDVSAGDLVVDADLVVVTSAQGRVRQYPASLLYAGDGGLIQGLIATKDPVLAVSHTNAQQKLFFVTQQGRAFALGAHQIPDSRQQPEGIAVESLARLDAGESVVATFPLDMADAEHSLMLVTSEGRVKRVTLADANSVNRDVVPVIGLVAQDLLVGGVLAGKDTEIMLVTAEGRTIRFAAQDVRPQGLPAQGMKGIELKPSDAVVAVCTVRDDADLLIVTANGFAKRSSLREYSSQGRGGQGLATLDPGKSATTGAIVSAVVVNSDDQVLVGTSDGGLVQRSVSEIPRLERTSWGRLVTRTRSGAIISLAEGERVVACVVLTPGAETGGSVPSLKSPTPTGGDSEKPSPTRGATARRTTGTAAKSTTGTKSGTSGKPGVKGTRSAEGGKPSGIAHSVKPAVEEESVRKTARSKSSPEPSAEPAGTTRKRRRISATSAAVDKTAPATEQPASPARTTRRRGPKAATPAPVDQAAPVKRSRSRAATAAAVEAGAPPQAEPTTTGTRSGTARAKPPAGSRGTPAVEPASGQPAKGAAQSPRVARRKASRTPKATPAKETPAEAPVAQSPSAPVPSRRRSPTSTSRDSGAGGRSNSPADPAVELPEAENPSAAPSRRGPGKVLRQSPQRRRTGE